MRPPESWSRARVTLGLAIFSTIVWVVLSMAGRNEWATVWGGFVPARIGDLINDAGVAPVWLTPLTAAFLHANAVHLLFNMMFLLFCGRATENVIGPVGLGLLYLFGAYAAAAMHYLIDPSSLTPMIGASGAISAVLGAYAMLFGRNKVKISNATLALWLNALWLLAAWVVLNLIVSITFARMGGGQLQLALGAHIGGFLIGLALANPLLLLRYRKA